MIGTGNGGGKAALGGGVTGLGVGIERWEYFENGGETDWSYYAWQLKEIG